MQVHLITTTEALEALRNDWVALQDRMPGTSVFMTWEWQFIWWKHYGQGQPLRVLVVKDGERVLGILPLYLQRRRVFKFFPVRLLRNVGTGGDTTPDDLDPLIDPDQVEAVAAALVDHLLTQPLGQDLTCLADFQPGSVFARLLHQGSVNRSRSLHEGSSATITYTPLPLSWDAYLESLHRDRRNVIRRFRRKLEATPGARLFTWSDLHSLDEGVDRLIELHHARWTEKGGSHAFRSDAYCGFHREVMRTLFAQGRLRLHGAEVDGHIVALLYCYRFRDRVLYFQGGFDPEVASLRPGLTLMGYAIEQAIAEGAQVFDMLRGEYDFKTQWAKRKRSTAQATVFEGSLAAALWRLRMHLLPPAKRFLQPLQRPLSPLMLVTAITAAEG
ncbi:MAG: GNAT family N-acetyltransferase [Leptothrix sp. (in: Bacteria)]|nr:GNAT family N-acetyltransferase [Leptothrix sp. (in: b-proteobacteria)]